MVMALHLPGGAPWLVQLAMALAGMAAGGLLILVAGALRHYQVNETISSLLLTYIAIAVFNHLVEGPMRDPASLNKPSTAALDEGTCWGCCRVWRYTGLVYGPWPVLGVRADVAYGVWFCRAYGRWQCPCGAASRLVDWPSRPHGVFLAGAAAGLAGMVEVTVHGRANASLAGYGYTGILVAFLARHHALAIIPVAVLLGGISASGGLLQRRLGLPDATVLVLQGILFVVILSSETLRERLQRLRRVTS